MNSREPFHEVGELLRSQKPDLQPSPGLEMRILRALPSRENSTSRRVWPWFLLPPAVAMGVILLAPKPSTPPMVTQHPEPVKELRLEPDIAESALSNNPLKHETLALQRDAKRAGRFLIECLPSLEGE